MTKHHFEHELGRYGDKETYTVANPHPLFGKDPNIMNELGHTHYPKFVEHPTEKENGKPKRVVVEDAAAEAELLGKKVSKEWTK